MGGVVNWVLVVLWSVFVLGCNAKVSNNEGEAGGTGGGGPSGSGGFESGSGGSGGGPGQTGFFDVLRMDKVSKVDLLLVVDNSRSMADKQEYLALAVPELVDRLVKPVCVSEDDSSDQTPPDANGNCQIGHQRAFDPIDDIHIGVVTSSLGGHGAEICTPDGPNADSYDPSQNDAGHLLGTLRPNLSSFNAQGFLAWDPTSNAPAGAENSVADLNADFADHVRAAGELGCGYEATLEAWYRFLIDPSPPSEIVVEDGQAAPARNGDGSVMVDSELLAQRANFLRPDSVVVILMLTDENDCSVVDGGIGYLTAQATLDDRQFNLPESTSACDQDPNSPCCRSCGLNEGSPPSGCGELSDDPKCAADYVGLGDPLNLRCYAQKRRFGFDLLYPIQRYVDGLTQPQVYDTHNCASGQCPLVENPLFSTGSSAGTRDPSLVFLAGIVGVPWQDIATPQTLTGSAALVFKTAPEMLNDGTYGIILGDPATHVPAADPLMVETPDERSGTNPIVGDALVDATSTDPQANPINGHESDNSASRDDLQYACIFPLSDPRDCLDATGACDCTDADLPKNRPLCNPPGGGDAETTQYYAKAYPSLRHLHVLRDFGQNAVIGSVCPRETEGSADDAGFGYNPAMAAIASRLSEVLQRRCLPRSLRVDSDGFLPCVVVEATRVASNVPPCDQRAGRTPVELGAEVDVDARATLADSGYCGSGTGVDCSDFELCEIAQLDGAARDRCLNEVEESDDGFCYIDAFQEIGNPTLLSRCPESQKQLLRFVGANGGTPTTGAITLIGCYPQGS